MSLDIAVRVPFSLAYNASLDTITLVLLHLDGHFRVLERNLNDFLYLERQLQLEGIVAPHSALASCSSSIDDFFEAKERFYTSTELGVRLAITLEGFLRQLTSNSELLTRSVALKTFLHQNYYETVGHRYRDAVETALRADQMENELLEEKVAAGCSVEHEVTLNMKAEEQIVLWKFASQGTGLVFSAQFSCENCEGRETESDPYSISSNESVEKETDEKDVVHYRTSCNFETDAEFLYGHYVAKKNGVLTLQWENADMSSVVSKGLQFQVKMLPLSAARKVLESADAINSGDNAEWLHDHMLASNITSVDDLAGWKNDDTVFSEESTYDHCEDGDSASNSQNQSIVLEERNHELEAQVIHLEKKLATTKKELKSALDRVQIAEEIYKANLETITQLECTPKASKVASKTDNVTVSLTETCNSNGVQKERETVSGELNRLQNLCAGFQEQCLWRSVENIELEAQLAASKVETSSWRDRHVEQTAQLEELANQIRTLRMHKKMLVQEVKRLQPYSQINLAALVQEAQEARMVQRSLQAKLDSHELLTSASGGGYAESNPTDFVLVEASETEA